MTKFLQFIFFSMLFTVFFTTSTFAQEQKKTVAKDSVVQLYGLVMTSDSLVGLEGVSISVIGKSRGTLTNAQGVFSIAVLKGDDIEFSYVGYESKKVNIPIDLEGVDYSIVQLLTSDSNYLPNTIIRPRPTKEQFERDFVNMEFPNDMYENARQNLDANKRMALMRSLPSDGKEAVNYSLKQSANKATYAGQVPPMQILNPMAWQQFIQSWKRGDFKKKKTK
ncbi:carboxypeptidase-like regulatory domain-containing protein [Polluticaenibacter yanchengensis]|uniref:Carboxypeptidase-like regulatory domain-containing protein n=1 Tax=Polluticaenibacter yanchengensis TaxID=3014562 RepID=A0ABT4UJC7_9BACT|nr:carboxypeptidase-like regulatory domain-containing protein [Chitinophagaceae bacterium LY-5]